MAVRRLGWQWLESDLPRRTGAYRTHGATDLWWWLGIPIALGVGPAAVYLTRPDIYGMYFAGEAGLIEVGQIIVSAISCLLALLLLSQREVRRSRFLTVWLVLIALGSLYLAGEEASWGQHSFGWSTPESWQAINDQRETNFHNTSALLDQFPRNLLRAGVLLGGFVLPLAFWRPGLHASPVALIIPPVALAPGALGAVIYKVTGDLPLPELVARHSELEESFLTLFVLFYLIVLRERMSSRSSAECA